MQIAWHPRRPRSSVNSWARRVPITQASSLKRKPRRRQYWAIRDLQELWTILKESIKGSDIPAWLRSESEAFAGQRPLELLKEGKARDIIVEFRRLQAGEPA